MLATDRADELRLAVVEEQVSVDRRPVDTDRVRIRTTVDTEEVIVEETVSLGRLAVERIAMDRAVAEAPEPRQEGDTLILSVVEERLVVEKRLFVVEEVRVTGSSRDEIVRMPVSLRRTNAVIERIDGDEPATGRD